MDILLLSILGGIISLDTSYVLQIGFSQPLIIATLLGFIYNDFTTALKIGFILQFMLLNKTIGELVILPDLPVITILSVFWCIKYKTNLFVCLVIIILSFVLGKMYRGVILKLREFNKFFVYKAEKYIVSNTVYKILLLPHIANIVSFLSTTIYLFICLYLSGFVIKNVTKLPIFIKLEERFVYDILLLLGLAIALNMFSYIKLGKRK